MEVRNIRYLVLAQLIGCAFESAPAMDGATDAVMSRDNVPAPPTTDTAVRFPDGAQGSQVGSPPIAGPSDGNSDAEPRPATPPPAPPAAEVDAGAPPGEAPTPPGVQDSTDPPVESPITRDPGAVLSRCSIDAGCEKGLRCFDSAPGFCTEPCGQDSDCGAHEGFEFECVGEAGVCRIACQLTADDCPQGFLCAGLGAVLTGTGSCVPEFVEGGGDRLPLEPCNVQHGDTDCGQGLVCYRWNDTREDGPGYCTPPCSSASTCQLPSSGETSLGCGSEGACRFSCTNAACPPFLECEELEDMGGRCRYPADTPY